MKVMENDADWQFVTIGDQVSRQRGIVFRKPHRPSDLCGGDHIEFLVAY